MWSICTYMLVLGVSSDLDDLDTCCNYLGAFSSSCVIRKQFAPNFWEQTKDFLIKMHGNPNTSAWGFLS